MKVKKRLKILRIEITSKYKIHESFHIPLNIPNHLYIIIHFMYITIGLCIVIHIYVTICQHKWTPKARW